MSGSRAERWGMPQSEPNFSTETRFLRDLLYTEEVVIPVNFLLNEKPIPVPQVHAEVIFQDGVTYRGMSLFDYRFHTAAVVALKTLYPMGQMYTMNVAHRWNQSVTGYTQGNSGFRLVATMMPKDAYEYSTPRVTDEPIPPLYRDSYITLLTLQTNKANAEESYDIAGFATGEMVKRPGSNVPQPTLYVEELRGLMELPEYLELTLRKIISIGLTHGFEWPSELVFGGNRHFPNTVSPRGDFGPMKEMYEIEKSWATKREVMIQVVVQIGRALQQKQIDWELIEDGLEDLYTLYPDLYEQETAPYFSSLDFHPDRCLDWLGQQTHTLGKVLMSHAPNGFIPSDTLRGIATHFNLVSAWLDLKSGESDHWIQELGLR